MPSKEARQEFNKIWTKGKEDHINLVYFLNVNYLLNIILNKKKEPLKPHLNLVSFKCKELLCFVKGIFYTEDRTTQRWTRKRISCSFRKLDPAQSHLSKME
jgi:hypothetical protein